jgi:hypothetical protein
MTNRRLVLALWIVFAFVTWNVVFDRRVAVAAIEFTRDQVGRHERGEPVLFIEDAFTPRVRTAALEASLYAGAVLAAGGLVHFRGRAPRGVRADPS